MFVGATPEKLLEEGGGLFCLGDQINSKLS